MKIDRKTSDKQTAAKSSRLLEPKAVKKRGTARKKATRQKTGVATLDAAEKMSSKKAPSATSAKPAKLATKKAVRGDFKMPASDYALIQALKQRALEFDRPTRKNELLRAGLHALGALDNTQLQQRLLALSPARSRKSVSRSAKSSKAKASA